MSPATAPSTARDYTGNIAKIEATDASTVVFTLCNPDPAFLPKVAFSPFAINDADYLISAVPDGSIVDKPNGTGPFVLEEWRRGSEVIFAANPDVLGRGTHEQPRPSCAGRRSPARSSSSCSPAPWTASTIPSVDDLGAIEADPALAVIPREGLNVFYVGMNNTYEPFTNEKVRQAIAMGIDKQRIVDSFYSPGSTVADYFTPCVDPLRLRGRRRSRPSTPKAPRRCWPKVSPSSASTPSPRCPSRCASWTAPTCPSRSRSRWTSRTSSRRTWASRPPSTSRNRAPSSTTPTPATCRASTCWAGTPTTPIPPTSLTTTSAPAPATSSARASRTSTRP